LQRIASLCISTSALFLIVVAVMLNSPALFYMATAVMVLLGACRLQARLAVRGLRFDRVAPESVKVGDVVTVEIVVWSERQVKRPLVTIRDNFPARMLLSYLSPSLPIAPAFDMPIRTQYQFRPLKRGRYKWSGVTVFGTDALGLISLSKTYETSPAEITVLPAPIAVSVELPAAAGWGISEAESGKSRGAGLEPRGIREYASGDSLRHVHWRSTARRGQLLVKEFEAGSHAAAAFVIQRTQGSEVGDGANTSLEKMCGHAVFLTEQFLRQGANVIFPSLEDPKRSMNSPERLPEIYHLLAGVQADEAVSAGAETLRAMEALPQGSSIFVMVCVQDESLISACSIAAGKGYVCVPLLYDATVFKQNTKVKNVVNSDYMDRLRVAGGLPVVMPVEGIS